MLSPLTNLNRLQKKSVPLILVTSLLLTLLQTIVLPGMASAAQLTVRKLTLSTSSSASSAATTTYTFNFTTATTATFQSFSADICTTASGSCSTPTGFLNSSSTFTSSTITGTWAVNTSTAGSIRATVSSGAASTTAGTAKNIIFGNVQNPTTTNQTFFARMTLYSDTSYATPVDTGTVAASTATQISLSGTMDESLVFCTGTSITGQNCGTVAGSTVSFGTFSTSATSSGTSVMAASTNGGSGYSITINGTTLTCTGCAGSPTIAAMTGAANTSTIGTAEFGVNLKDNATPNVGAEVSGPGSGVSSDPYDDVDEFFFQTGDPVASATAATDADTFTVSYIVNVPGSQAAGTYTATMTYICTATF